MKLGNIVKKMRLDHNSLVLIKTGSSLASIEALTSIQETLAQTPLRNVILVVADSLDDALIVHEKELNKLGWFHVKALAEKINKDHAIEDTTGEEQND